MAQSLDEMIAAAQMSGTDYVMANILPPVPRHSHVTRKKTRVEISTRLEDHDRVIIEALCARYNMSRAAMIVELHRCSTARINKRLEKIDCELTQIRERRS